MVSITPKKIIGWKEWASLPELGINKISVKIDTGAKTSSLHAESMKVLSSDGKLKVRFSVHQLHQKRKKTTRCEAYISGNKIISDSGGHREKRYVIKTPIRMGDFEWMIEITLTDRASMKLPMLLGRSGMKGIFVVDPHHTYKLVAPSEKKYKKIKRKIE